MVCVHPCGFGGLNLCIIHRYQLGVSLVSKVAKVEIEGKRRRWSGMEIKRRMVLYPATVDRTFYTVLPLGYRYLYSRFIFYERSQLSTNQHTFHINVTKDAYDMVQ
jgi:hypothetical protein